MCAFWQNSITLSTVLNNRKDLKLDESDDALFNWLNYARDLYELRRYLIHQLTPRAVFLQMRRYV